MTLPNPTTTPIPAIDPATGEAPSATPDLFNSRYLEIDANMAYIDEEITIAKSAIESAGGRIDEAFSGIAEQADRVTSIENHSAGSVENALKLDWAYKGGMKFALELFYESWTLREEVDVIVTDAVAGDDSLDVDDSSTLQVGQEYALFDDTHSESVKVTVKLTNTRVRLAEDLTYSYSNATMKRTSWDVTGGQATTRDGGVYYASGMNMGNDDQDKAIIIRRDDNDTVLTLFFKDDDHGDWTDVPWGWKRYIEDGVIDVEYRVPARGVFSFKITSAIGSDEAADIYHIAATSSVSGLGGEHHAPEQPVNSYPANAAAGLIETPTLAIVSYQSAVSAALSASRFLVTSLPGDYSEEAMVLDSGEIYPGSLSCTIPAGILTENKTFYWKAAVMDEEGAWSSFSQETSFTTDTSWEYVNTPVNQGPTSGATDVPEQPTLSASGFATTSFPLISLSDGVANQWVNSGTTSGEYYCAAANAPEFKPSKVFAGGAELAESTLGSLAAGQWAWGDQDTMGVDRIYVKLAAGDPDGQAANYLQCGESHAYSRWRVRNAASGTVVYDSGAVSDLTSHVIPAGYLQAGEAQYLLSVQYQGENIGWSEWSQETGFTTKDVFANIIGIALVSSGGGAGSWQRVDANGNDVNPVTTYFNNHPVWGGIQDVTIDSQAMVKIPKFYVKVGTLTSGARSGKKAWMISNQPASGFELSPAFMDGGVELDQVYVGKYEAAADGTMVKSASGVTPLHTTSFTGFKTKCEARNTGGVDGFHLINIYELAAIQMLALIEMGTPDMQSAISAGNTTGGLQNTGISADIYRGINQLWSNTFSFIDGLKVTTAGNLQVFDRNGNNTYVTVAAGISGSTFMGWPVSMLENNGTNFDCKHLFLASSVDGIEGNGTFADYQYFYQNSSNEYIARHGGGWHPGSGYGLFCVSVCGTAANADASSGARLAKV